jgi:hypothetical protein
LPNEIRVDGLLVLDLDEMLDPAEQFLPRLHLADEPIAGLGAGPVRSKLLLVR